MDRESAINYIRTQDPSAFMQKARKKGFVCPLCNNGTGSNGDGIVRNPHDGRYKCFKCGAGGDVIDLIGMQFNLDDFNDQLKKGCEVYGVTIDETYGSSTASLIRKKPSHEESKKVARMEYIEAINDEVRNYIGKCHTMVDQTDYFNKRGITPDSIERFNLGFDPAYGENVGRHTWEAIIIPTSETTYEVRNTKEDPNSKTGGGNRYRKHGSNQIFNSIALQEETEKPIFICEGIIDAISIIQSGGQAIGLGGAVNYRTVLGILEKTRPAQPLVLLLDSDETGKKATDEFAAKLTDMKIPFIRPEDVVGNYHDPNDRYLQDPDGLKEAITKVYQEAAELPDPNEGVKYEYLATSAGKSISALMDAIQINANRPRLSTGFKAIDEALDGGLYTGLYFIGAISSLGKTTLTLQIADNLAQQGRDVLFFTLEQSKYDLMTKSISRETFFACRNKGLNTSNAKTNLGIWDGRRWENYSATERDVINDAIKTYESYAHHIFYYEGIGSISVDFIREKVVDHIRLTGNKFPIVMIDYLQILKACAGDERATDKQVVDHNVTALKQLSRDLDIPIVAVSSLNRANYSETINMAAFKESGAIEYGSDVLIGLQLTGAGGSNFDVTKAKAENPRRIDFCILKNRNGKVTADGVKMTFYPMFNCFMDANGVNGDGGFVPLSREDEDNLPFGGLMDIPDVDEDELLFD